MRAFSLVVAAALLAGCVSVQEARMAVPAELSGSSELAFGRSGWGQSGQFALAGQGVRYERAAPRLTLFETYTLGRAPLRVQLDGGRQAECAARQDELKLGRLGSAMRLWTLVCDWQGAGQPAGRLEMGEGLAELPLQSREGRYQRGELLLQLRSVHRLDGVPFAQPVPVGYEFLQAGRAVGSLDLSRGTPVLRRPDPCTPLGQAVTEAALALALVWEPN